MPRLTSSAPTLVGIGLTGGFFGALFGVGGGIVVIPLLIFAGFRVKVATATSLAIIGFTAVFGVIAFGALGHVSWGDAALVGLPALGGTLAGTWAHRRLSSRMLTFLFAGFLVLVAIRLVLE